MPGCVRKILEKAEEVVEGGFGRSKDWGGVCFLLSSPPTLPALPVCPAGATGTVPSTRSSVASLPHVPSASPSGHKTGSCLHDPRQVSAPDTAPSHIPHAHPAKAPMPSGHGGWSSEPSLVLHHESPSQPGEATGLSVPLGGVQRGVSSLPRVALGRFMGQGIGLGCCRLDQVAWPCTALGCVVPW